MLFTLTTTHQPATDLGYLLHKNPGRIQAFSLSFGKVHIFYPEVTAERCTAALLLDIDHIKLVRRKDEALSLEQYVNDLQSTQTNRTSGIWKHFQKCARAMNHYCSQQPVKPSMLTTTTAWPRESRGGSR